MCRYTSSGIGDAFAIGADAGSPERAALRVHEVRLPARLGMSRYRSKQRQLVSLNAAQGVVVDDDAADAAVLGEDTGLGLDLLGGEDAGDRREQRVATQQFQVAGQLLDPVDLAPAFHLD